MLVFNISFVSWIFEFRLLIMLKLVQTVKANRYKIVKKWENSYFVQIYIDRLRTVYINIQNEELLFKLKSKPAALYSALSGFALNGVNLTKLQL